MARQNFRNRTIWTGDNLDVMRGLNSETVDLIYLDLDPRPAVQLPAKGARLLWGVTPEMREQIMKATGLATT